MSSISEHDARRRSREAPAIEVDLAETDADGRAPAGEVLQPRQRRLAHQVGTGLRTAADRDLQRGVRAQRVDVVAILVAGRDHQHPCPCHVGVAVADAGRIAIAAQRSGDSRGQSEAALDLAQDHQPAVRGQAAGIEGGCERLGSDR